jgi:hypothetical protein
MMLSRRSLFGVAVGATSVVAPGQLAARDDGVVFFRLRKSAWIDGQIAWYDRTKGIGSVRCGHVAIRFTSEDLERNGIERLPGIGRPVKVSLLISPGGDLRLGGMRLV